MIKKIVLIISLCPFVLTAQQPVHIIPQPVSVHVQPGHFVLTENTTVQYNPKQKELKSVIDFLNQRVKAITGFALPLNASGSASIRISIEKQETIGTEGYTLEILPQHITIKANTTAGIIYGVQSLFQLLPAIRTNATAEIPCMKITDYPRFKYRGMHLDVSRHFFGPDFVKEYIDLLATYKMNVFHWHLVDDQGWRIEIKKYPELTRTGAWRVDHTDKGWRNRPQAKPGEAATYGGYYTHEQIKDIIQYAAARNVTIIPEIEMPGHVASAIASYPQLSCSQQPQLPLTGGNYTGMSSNYCAGNDSVFVFLENVLTEVVQLFPSGYIHMGGDEVDKTPWKHCARCQARIKNENLKNEEELQSYFIQRMEKFLLSKKRKMIGWDEILEGGLAPEATVMSWRGESGGVTAAKMNHDVIMTPGKPVYFDHYQAGPEGEPIAIGGMNTLRNVYAYEPIPAELNAEQAKHVLGAQANVWTEFITTTEHVEYMILPRMLALSEVVWSPKENRNWNDFNERLQYHFSAFGQKGFRYCPGNYTVGIKPETQNGKLVVSLVTDVMRGNIYYTTDGSEPTLSSIEYTTPVEINTSVSLKASVAVDGRIMGVQAARQNFVLHTAIGKHVTYTNPVSRYYPADGPNALTDGVRGTNMISKYWHGISEKDLIATIDLGEVKNIKTLVLGCLQNYGDWIFLPQSVTFETSTNGIDFKELQRVNNPIAITEKNARFDFKATFTTSPARYIRVTAKNNLCPPGHSGEGKPGWIFADEIVVE